jgi:hypothetical protein
VAELAPIVLFVYNRIGVTKRTVDALKQNKLAKGSELFIFCDGAKKSTDISGVNEVREFVKKITGFKSINIVERDSNYGLSKSIIDGVTHIVNKFDKIIVLEDDLITSQHFLTFMNDGLTTYEKDKQVASIHGYIYPIGGLPDLFFIKGADCWGWATWKDRWDLFEPDGNTLLDKVNTKKVTMEANFNNSFSYTNMLKQQISGENDSWAIRWYFSMFLLEKLTLYPGKSYVQNIGFDGQGTHSKPSENFFEVPLNQQETSSHKIDILEYNPGRIKMEKFFLSIRPSLKQRVWRKLKRIFNFGLPI